MPRVYRDYRPTQLSGMTDAFPSLGVTMWEWLNPAQVLAEAEAIGAEPPEPVSFGDVIGAAAEDTRGVVVGAAQDVTEGAEQIAGGAQRIVIAGAIAAVIAAAWWFSQERRK